jgi:hypothetical protein
VNLTKEIVSARGHVDQQTIDSFLAAGYQKEQVLEVLIGVALKTISNYTDHLSPNELDNAFAADRWVPAGQTRLLPAEPPRTPNSSLEAEQLR